ncbi:protein NRT1/ PTR FAMILY 2.6 isoform X2 [Arachis ipaensis]|uniref:protein NRT1/ PTR FAMILY 2.6 isoform X2 n=1 Tax=Arachis ipaensis TaxID=130454 RepID=UPI000A2AFA81|nr:protein NRT1/ PTR FAMILY 2.6 isoform X2 [Arachis ipaensis]
MERTHSSLREEEARKNNTSGSKPATVAGITLASSGIWANLIVYLIQEFNIKSISATQISNVVNGTTNLVPFVAAIIADCFFGSFTLVLVSSCVSLLGTIVFALTASIKSLRPKQCINNGSNLCEAASMMQYGVLYVGIALAAIGFGGTRFTTAALGANQFHDNTHHQNIFFNWFFFTWYVVSVAGFTGVVYIQDNVSWGVGFWICVVSNMIGVMVFLMGYRYYLPQTPQGSAFVDLARVPVASIRKWKSQLSSSTHDYYNGAHHHDATLPPVSAIPAKRFRFFNRAALVTEGDSIEKSWRLCSVQQVEDFKKVIGILPLLTSSIFLAIPIGMESNLSLLQALVMEAHLGPHFKFPAGSLGVILLISTSIFLSLLDRVLWPFYQKLTGKTPTPLQRIGVGHVFNILGMVVSAIVESKRLKMFHDANKSMSILWLFPQLVLVGVGEAFHFPGQVAFYYQQLPQALSSTSTAMISLIIGIAFYLITALTHEIRRSTHWLPDNIDYGRVDNVYWMLVLFSGINFVYYLICATFYKYSKI